jgi:hypothetical protein
VKSSGNFSVDPSNVHGTPEGTDFLIDIVSDRYVLSDRDRITFLAKLVKNIPKEDWPAVQRMMGTSTSEACPKQSAFWDHITLPTWQWLLPEIAQKATKSRMHISDSIWKALKDLLEQWLPFKVIHSSSTLRRVRIDGMVPNSGFVVDSIVDNRTNEPSGVAFLALDSFKLQLESVMGVMKQTHSAVYSNCKHKGIVVVDRKGVNTTSKESGLQIVEKSLCTANLQNVGITYSDILMQPFMAILDQTEQ